MYINIISIIFWLASASWALAGEGQIFPVELEKRPSCGNWVSSAHPYYVCNLTDPPIESVKKAESLGWNVERIIILAKRPEDGIAKVREFLEKMTSVLVDLHIGPAMECVIVVMSPPRGMRN